MVVESELRKDLFNIMVYGTILESIRCSNDFMTTSVVNNTLKFTGVDHQFRVGSFVLDYGIASLMFDTGSRPCAVCL